MVFYQDRRKCVLASFAWCVMYYYAVLSGRVCTSYNLRFDCASTGPFVSILVNAFGCRRVTIVGGLIVTGGMLTSVFAPSVSYLVVTLGFVTGA